ncbi:MAG: glycine--tRNA ligase [Chloroflexi bacterium]|nr:glycine--tRNA ligase [Chloroflexota bacterium]MCH8065674.1 glycine--tRNA ligase [Chloroflexota bacterium]
MSEETPTPGVSLDTIASLCKRRGFIFQSSEIYGGFESTWDYGPLGVELKRNIKQAWWKAMVQDRDDIVGLDSSILMSPKVWEASGHLSNFGDSLVECKSCQRRFREDELSHHKAVGDIESAAGACPECGGELSEPRQFKTMFKTFVGPVEEEAAVAYLRPETAQGIFVNFDNVLNSTRKKLPFGIAQQGKSFRNEITTGNFIFRTREFEQMEMEYFVKPGTDEEWYQYWRQERLNWFIRLGVRPERLRLREHEAEELSHYSSGTSDIEYFFPMGWAELEGIAKRTDFDLKAHAAASGKRLDYFDEESGEHIVPYVVEPALGVDRCVLVFLLDAYEEEEVRGEQRTLLRLHPALAPVKIAVLPLSRKDTLAPTARTVYELLRPRYMTQFDDAQSIGRRYRRQDEIGTPLCVTVDFDTLEDEAVTIRERDSMEQVRVPIAGLLDAISERLPDVG